MFAQCCSSQFKKQRPQSLKKKAPPSIDGRAGTVYQTETGPANPISALLQLGQVLAHPPRALVDILLGHRVGDADVFRRAECLTRNRHHVRLVQQPRGQLRRRA